MKKFLSLLVAAAMAGAVLPVSAAETSERSYLANLSFDGGLDNPQINVSLGGGVDEGVVGDAAIFTGSIWQYLTITDTDGSNNLLVGQDAVTIMFWEKRNSGTWPLFIAPNTDAQSYNSSENYIGLYDSGSIFKVERYVGTRGASTSSSAIASAYPETLKDGWKHVAIVLTDTKTDLYVNGALVASAASSSKLSDLFPTESYIQIGRGNWGDGETFNGYIDEFKIVSGELSAEEIAAEAVFPEKTIDDIAAKVDIPDTGNILDSISLVSELDGATIEWTSSNTDVVTDDVTTNTIDGTDYSVPAGSVTRGDSDESVTLTAEISYGGETRTKSFDLTVKARNTERENEEKVAYLYAYFRGNVKGSDEHLQIHVATSEDGYTWTDLNGNWPIVSSTMGTTGLRDPYIIRSRYGDKFYLIATDLNTLDAMGWSAWSLRASKYLAIWESEDLIHWSDERLVKFANDDMGCAWAPEAIYDEETDEYLVYAAGKDLTMDSPVDTVYVVRTRDFRTFSEPEYFTRPFDESGKRINAIDSSIIKADDGKYYQFYKKYSSKVVMTVSDHASGPYEEVSAFTPIAGEGPAEYKVNNSTQYCLCVDDYTKYVPYLTDDIASGIFTKGTGEVTMPTGSKHGVMVPLTKSEYAAVLEAYGPKDVAEDGAAPILSYDFETEPDGMNGNAEIVTDEEKGKVLSLDGSDGTYFELPADSFRHLNTFTLSMDVLSKNTSGNYFTFGLGTDDNYYYMFKTATTSARAAITNGGYSYEEKASATISDEDAEWAHYDLVVEPTAIKIYRDGIKIAEGATTITASHVGMDDLKAYLGKSFFSADGYFKGSFDNVKLYDRVLTDAEILENCTLTDEEKAETDAEAAITELAGAGIVTEDILLPSQGSCSSTITWQTSNADIIAADGTVNRPEARDGDAKVTLTGTFVVGDAAVTKEVVLTVKAQAVEWVSTNDWTCQSFDSVSGEDVYIDFDITPSTVADSIVGIASADITPGAWGDYNIGIGINAGGYFQAYNTNAFAYVNKITPVAGETYHIAIKTDTAAQTYSAWVVYDGNVTLLADNYGYRKTTGSDLCKVNIRGGNNVAAGLFTVSSFEAGYSPYYAKTACVNDDGSVQFSLASFADEDNAASVDLYMAFYDENGAFISAKRGTTTPLSAGSDASLEALSEQIPANCAYVKLMAWENDSSKPVISYLRRAL